MYGRDKRNPDVDSKETDVYGFQIWRETATYMRGESNVRTTVPGPQSGRLYPLRLTKFCRSRI